ncbi:MAG TPA: type IVB secretion system protein IcmH/DotU [Planctomycetota bacterium]|nr:type IVB secretion system protein IcmH/DotU [Planctomycetota bacterium]
MAESTPTAAPPALADLCGDLLAFQLQLKRSSDPGDAEVLRQKIDEQFRALETRARQADVPQEDVQQAKYAIAAFIDEMILTSSWGLKDSWADKPLQLAYFNDFAAGEEFYNKIDALRGAKRNNVLEVYYLCLALGFRGKYVDLQGMEKKKVLMDTMLREIRGAVPAVPAATGLSSSWQPPDALPGIVKNFPAWFVAAACGLFIILLFILLSTLLGSSAENLVKSLN